MLVAGQARGELSLGTFEQMNKGSKNDRFAVEMYMGGVGKAYLQANASLEAKKQQPLFCFDGDYTTKQLLDLVKQHVKYIHSINPGEKDIPMELVLLMKLQQLHPCK